MPPESRILFHEYGTELRLEPDDSLILNVLCGRIGEFGVEFALNDQERHGYNQDGDAFLKNLSREVRREWKPYVARARSC